MFENIYKSLRRSLGMSVSAENAQSQATAENLDRTTQEEPTRVRSVCAEGTDSFEDIWSIRMRQHQRQMAMQQQRFMEEQQLQIERLRAFSELRGRRATGYGVTQTMVDGVLGTGLSMENHLREVYIQGVRKDDFQANLKTLSIKRTH